MAVTAAGAIVIDGELVLPRVGAWHADLVVQSSVALTGACPIVVDGVGTFNATVERGGLWLDTAWVRVSAGAGGVTSLARAQHYHATTIGAVAADLARAGGEVLAGASDQATLGVNLPRYTQLACGIGNALSALLDLRTTARAWRYLPDGTIWIGTETWPDSGLTDLTDYQDLSEQPQMGQAELGFESPGLLLPGTSLGGRNVSTVTYKFSGSSVRASVLFED